MISSDDNKDATNADESSACNTNYTSHFSLLTSHFIKSSALQLGFSACGIAKAEPVDEDTARAYRQWIADGRQADMHYLEANIDKRLDPTLLLPGARSIIVVAMSYAPARRLPKGEYQIADYALGRDYHDVMKQRLRQLAESAGLHEDVSTQKLCVDTVPILERYWAVRAGLGFIGRNHQLIIPGQGSMVFLGEIVTTAETDRYDEPLTLKDHPCSDCRRCLDACPTGALTSHFSPHTSHLSPLTSHFSPLTSSACLSYQTIEHHGPLADGIADKLGTTIYGCDRCQRVCPHNRLAEPTTIAELQPSEALMNMRRDDWHRLSREDYQRLFRGSAVKRAKYEGLMRNIEAVELGVQPPRFSSSSSSI